MLSCSGIFKTYIKYSNLIQNNKSTQSVGQSTPFPGYNADFQGRNVIRVITNGLKILIQMMGNKKNPRYKTMALYPGNTILKLPKL